VGLSNSAQSLQRPVSEAANSSKERFPLGRARGKLLGYCSKAVGSLLIMENDVEQGTVDLQSAAVVVNKT